MKLDRSGKFWDTISKRFVNSSRVMRSAALQTMRQHADKYFSPNDEVLDIGCGPGDITLEMARRAKMVCATDISEGMITSAKQKADEQKINNTTFIRTDLRDDNFQAESFDAISAFNMLQYVSDRQQLYEKIYMYLRPKGLFLSATACLRERMTVLRFLMGAMSLFRIGPEILFYTKSELENDIRKAGFTIIEATDITQLPERFIVARKD